MVDNTYNYGVNQRDKILRHLRKKKSASGRELSELLGISRQALNKHLKALIQEGHVAKEGSTRGAVYALAQKATPARRLSRRYTLKGLEEDIVFREVDLLLSLRQNLRGNVFDIFNYAFTEIVNNAIEHSRSQVCDTEVVVGPYSCDFRIRDYGIGIFHSIHTKLNLPDESSAVRELIKGKTTTMKESHTGEGVFFCSKAGDTVGFRSHKIDLLFDNRKKDVFVEEKRVLKGTEVRFQVSRATRRKLDGVFKDYAAEDFDYRFERTKVFVKLFEKEHVSRSEAKRLLLGLDKFREIVLDFKGVKSIGQGFADEILRVFKGRHPDIVIRTENLSPALSAIIGHVVDNRME